MKKRKKIWMAAVLSAVIETFAFPEILFPDCIQKQVEAEMQEYFQARKSKEGEFQWSFWFLK